jgi:hypothetical protein
MTPNKSGFVRARYNPIRPDATEDIEEEII